ncbi:hypothetical protein MRX96_042862 [Rhipicephalus microplus]
MILEKATSRVNLQTVRMKLCPRWLRSKKVTQMTTRLISHPQAQEKGGDHCTSGRSPKKKKRRLRSPEPVQSDNSDSRDVASEGTALWSTALPVLNIRSVSSLEPQYSSKLSSSCTPSESFSLYFDDDVLEMIVLETNRYAAGRRLEEGGTI